MWEDGDEFQEFPPVLHPKRELATMAIAAFIVLCLIGWGVSAFIRWL